MSYKIMLTFVMTALLLCQASMAGTINLDESSNINRPMEFIPDLRRIQSAFSDSGASDNTVVYRYREEDTYKIRTRVAMNTYIQLPEGEAISFYKFGDGVNFRFVPIKDPAGNNTNMGYIEVIYAGADTNLAIIGSSGNFYNFYVRVDDHNSKELPHHKVFVRDNDLPAKMAILARQEEKKDRPVKRPTTGTDAGISDYLRAIDNTPMELLYRNQNLDFRYIIYLRKNLVPPLAVFDDGFWTYFRLSASGNLDKLKDFPVLFRVSDGVEQPVNTRVVNNYIVAESLADTWALRVGERFLCVEKVTDDPSIILSQKEDK